MRTTPKIPSKFRKFVPSKAQLAERTSKWRNIYELCPQETRFFGTESLYGDWNGTLLLLAQDFSSVAEMKKRINDGDNRPFRHDPAIRTNRNLQRLADRTKCGILYGSVLAGLLRNWGEGISGRMYDTRNVLPYSRRALTWVIGQMSNLAGVACLGRFPTEVVSHPAIKELLVLRRVQIFAFSKPPWQWSMYWSQIEDQWAKMCNSLGIACEQKPAGTCQSDNFQNKKAQTSLAVAQVNRRIPITNRSRMPAPEVTAKNRKLRHIVDFYNGVPMAPRKNLDLPPAYHLPIPAKGGRAVVCMLLSQKEGATYAEVWDALRDADISGWNAATKLNGIYPSNGLGTVRKHGFRLIYDSATGVYRAVPENQSYISNENSR